MRQICFAYYSTEWLFMVIVLTCIDNNQDNIVVILKYLIIDCENLNSKGMAFRFAKKASSSTERLFLYLKAY